MELRIYEAVIAIHDENDYESIQQQHEDYGRLNHDDIISGTESAYIRD